MKRRFFFQSSQDRNQESKFAERLDTIHSDSSEQEYDAIENQEENKDAESDEEGNGQEVREDDEDYEDLQENTKSKE